MWLVVVDLDVRSFVVEVRSQSGNSAPVSLCQANVFLCPHKKEQGPTAQLFPSEVKVLAKRK